MRRAVGRVLLAGGLLAFLGLAGAAVLGLAAFAPFWAFLACAAAMAGLALRQPDPAGGRRPGPRRGPRRRAFGWRRDRCRRCGRRWRRYD